MEVTCEHCSTKLNVPDEKIPRGQAVKFACPNCKNRIVLDARQEEPGNPTAAASEIPDGTGRFHVKSIESSEAAQREEKGYNYQDYSDDKDLDFFEEGTKLALVLESNEAQAQSIKSAVEQLGYKYIPTPNTRDATGKMRFHHFDLVVLSDGFDEQPLEQSPILNYLNRMVMSIRRRIFVALLGDDFKTMDDMMAFAMSANLVINKKDMDRLVAILKKAISDNEKFYKVFMDLLAQTGKA